MIYICFIYGLYTHVCESICIYSMAIVQFFLNIYLLFSNNSYYSLLSLILIFLNLVFLSVFAVSKLDLYLFVYFYSAGLKCLPYVTKILTHTIVQ